jgi:hypothetical protein
MNTLQNQLQIIQNFHELGETILAAEYLVKEYELEHPNFKGFELREIAKPDFILMTTEGNFGEQQIIRIPENTFEFDLPTMLTLLAHEMVHVGQKQTGFFVNDKNEREWQAYYEMIFHKIYPTIPEVSDYYKKFFATKSLEYFARMGENSELQKKYENQKKEIDLLLQNLT